MVHDAEKVDLVWLCDPGSFRPDSGLNPDNYHHFLSRMLPLAYINPYLGSFMLMDSLDSLQSYIAANGDRYIVVPPYQDKKGRVLKDYTQSFNYIYQIHAEHGRIPYLSCRPSTVSWARLFMDKVAGTSVPVVVQLRNARDNTVRNAKLECWSEFFQHCQSRFDVRFIVIGDKEQLDDRIRSLPNVVFAKDHGTTAEQDMALIQTCCLYLGVTSGPAVMAAFSRTPYLIFNLRLFYTKLAPGSQHPFATPLQKLVWQPETTELLIKEFTQLFSQIDTAKWKADFQREVEKDRKKLVRRYEGIGPILQGWE